MMTHNEFDFFKDLIRPMLKFFGKIHLSLTQNEKISFMILKEMYYTDQDFIRIIRWERMKNVKKRKPRPAKNQVNLQGNGKKLNQTVLDWFE